MTTLAPTPIGTPVNRVDGRKKITGAAKYAADLMKGNEIAHAFLVGSAVAAGRITNIDSAAAESATGVLLILTHKNADRFTNIPVELGPGGVAPESRTPLSDDCIYYAGQCVAAVVAETAEQARFAASLLEISYEKNSWAVTVEEARGTLYQPAQFMHESMQVKRGDVDGALAAADVRLEATYRTPVESACALEPHAAIAEWIDGRLRVYNSSQFISGDAAGLSTAFNLSPDQVEVICPFTGGMFGSKAAMFPHILLAAAAARRIGRPVRAVLTRQDVLTSIPHRTDTIQKFELGAKSDGTLTAMRHYTLSHTSLKDEFIEPTNLTSRHLYEVPNYQGLHELVRINVMKPAWVRAPGEAPCQFALESALDELAVKLQMDPLELRRRNDSNAHGQTGKPYSNKRLLECYEVGEQRFGWKKRPAAPRSMREGDCLIGWGMATATYPGYLMGATIRVRLENTGGQVRATVSTAGSDVGTGMYTMLAITASDYLGLPLEQIEVKLGDSALPPCAVAGGSNLTASTAPAVLGACQAMRKKLGCAPGVPLSQAFQASGQTALEETFQTAPIFGNNDQFTFQSFGAHFVEVRVHEDIGRIRVSRIVSAFDCGRIISPKTARSQYMGGIVFGIGQALLEELVYDPQTGRAVNADLAGYLVPVHADVPEIDISWLDKPDFNFNPIGCRGLGEIGITGVAAAIANAVYHATGVRLRDLPLSPHKFLKAAAQID
jgi:xanthine dehydrogenase YagR molybdenum-binding subunit